jgi:hypothetical protein
MKKLFLIAAMSAGLFAYAQAEEATKYICSIGDMSDAVFTEEYANEAECRKYCKGIAAVCEKTGINTPVDLTEVD